MRELLGMYAAAAGVAPPRWQLPAPLMLLAGHLGILPLEVRSQKAPLVEGESRLYRATFLNDMSFAACLM